MTARALLLALAAVLAAPGAASAACTVSWDGGGGADRRWQTAANWPGDTLPAASANVCIPALGGDAPVVADGTITVATIETQHPVRVTGTLTATLSAGSFLLADGAVLQDATIDGADVDVARGATATARGGTHAAGTLGGPGDLMIGAPGLTWSGGDVDGTGVTAVQPGATLTMQGTGTAAAADIEFPANFQVTGSRTLVNLGTVSWPQGTLNAVGGATIVNAGVMTISADATDATTPFRTSQEPPFLNAGSVHVTGPGDLRLPSLDNDGTLRIDRALVRMFDVTMTGDATLAVGLAGPVPGVTHGQLLVTDRAWLQGRLALERDGAFLPALGDAFVVVDSFARSGTFPTVTGGAVAPGLALVPSYETPAVTVTVGALPVDRADGATGSGIAAPALTSGRSALRARADVLLARAGATVRIPAARGLLANDEVPSGTRIELLSRSAQLRVALDRHTGALRIRARRGAPRLLQLRYRLVAPDGRRSAVARVRVVVR